MRALTLGIAMLGIAFFLACGEDNGGEQQNELEEGFCNATNPCPDGQFCFNGICAIGCLSNDDCAADQYCDTEWSGLCHNREVETCPDTPCPDHMVCMQSLCSLPPEDSPAPSSCNLEAAGTANDGCDEYSICIDPEDNEQGECYTFPPCPMDGDCPTGLYGAVCNEGYIPDKARICLSGLCEVDENCPTNWNCVRFSPNDVLGMCSGGSMGELCTDDEHCVDGLACDEMMPGMAGMCMPDDDPWDDEW